MTLTNFPTIIYPHLLSITTYLTLSLKKIMDLGGLEVLSKHFSTQS